MVLSDGGIRRREGLELCLRVVVAENLSESCALFGHAGGAELTEAQAVAFALALQNQAIGAGCRMVIVAGDCRPSMGAI